MCSDYFTKWPEVYSLFQIKRQGLLEKCLVEEFISRFGVPLQLHSDQGRNFCSNIFAEMCHLLDIKKTQTTPISSTVRWLVARFLIAPWQPNYRCLLKVIRGTWDEYVPYLLMAYRTAVPEIDQDNPAKLMMGREIRVPIDLVFGRPNTECFEGFTEYGEKLAKNIEEAHEFAREALEDVQYADETPLRYRCAR